MRSRLFAAAAAVICLMSMALPIMAFADQLEDFANMAASDCGRNGAWYGYDSEWCARVVKYWAGQAGLGDAIPAVYSAHEMAGWFVENGNRFVLTRRDSSGEIKCWTSGSGAEALPSADYGFSPQRGDLVFLEMNGDPEDGVDGVGVCVNVVSDFRIEVAVGDAGSTDHSESTVQLVAYTWTANDSNVWGFVRLNGAEGYAEAEGPAEPVEFLSGDYIAVDLGDGTCEIVDYNGGWYRQYVDELEYHEEAIPDTLEGRRVVSIGSNAFDYTYNGVQRIVVPEGVTRIADSAFNYINSLETIVLPDSLSQIEGNPFKKCYGLTEIVLSDGNKSFRMENGLLIDQKNGRLVAALHPEGEVVLPADVTEIGDRAFADCDKITRITISASVSRIGEEAFSDCTGLESVSLCEGLTSIGTGAFANCDKLEELAFPASLTAVEGNLFYGCDNLKTVSVADGNPSLEMKQGFLIDTEEKRLIAAVQPQGSVKIPEDVVSIGDYAFFRCSGLNNVSIPDGVKHIGAYAFEYCDNLVSASMPDGLEDIGDCAFMRCSSLGELIVPEGIARIGEAAFRDCQSLKRIILPSSLREIDDCAFFDCKSLKSVVIPEGMVRLGGYAFGGCIDLNRVTLPASLSEMGPNPFEMDWRIESFSIAEQNASFIVDNGMLIDVQEMRLISALEDITTVQIPEGIREIGESAFSYHAEMVCIEFPQSLERIGDWAFEYCDYLERIEIPQHVVRVGDGAFNYCRSLTDVSFGDSVEYIGDGAFYYCYQLRFVVIPQSVKSIGEQAFAETDIQTIAFYGKKLEIGFNIFAGTYTRPTTIIGYAGTFAEALAREYTTFWKLEELMQTDGYLAKKLEDGTCEIVSYIGKEADLTIPGEIEGRSVSRIGEKVFENHTEICSVVLPAGLTQIGSYAFACCNSLISVVLPADLTQVGSYAFSHCNSLISVVFPAGLEEIGESAFLGCDSLTDAILPEGLLRIGESAFQACSALESVLLPDGVISLGSSAFGYCQELKSVVLPKGLTEIGDNPFRRCGSLETIAIHPENPRLKMEGDYLIDEDEKRLVFAYLSIERASVPEGIAVIGSGAFACCTDLREVELPESLESIGYKAFEDCSAVSEIRIPGNVTVIEDYTFRCCVELLSITFLEGSTRVSDKVFDQCDKLETVFILNNDLNWERSKSGSFQCVEVVGFPDTAAEEIANLLDGCFVDAERRRTSTNYSMIDLGDGTCEIAFYRGDESTVYVPSAIEGRRVVSIGASAFKRANKICKVILPEGITRIGEEAFANCKKLQVVQIPESVVSIRDRAFLYCSELTNIDMKGNSIQLGENVFLWCNKLKEVQ